MEDKCKQTRYRLKNISSIPEYNALMSQIKLTDIERRVCDLHYLNGMSMMQIGDQLHYSESGIKHIHRRVLKKVCDTLEI